MILSKKVTLGLKRLEYVYRGHRVILTQIFFFFCIIYWNYMTPSKNDSSSTKFITVQRWWWRRSQWKIGLNTKVWCCFYDSFPFSIYTWVTKERHCTCSNQIHFKTIFYETIFQQFKITPLLVNNISLKSCLNPFSTNVLVLNPLKTSENRKFFDVFRGCRKGTLVENGLINQWNYWISRFIETSLEIKLNDSELKMFH